MLLGCRDTLFPSRHPSSETALGEGPFQGMKLGGGWDTTFIGREPVRLSPSIGGFLSRDNPGTRSESEALLLERIRFVVVAESLPEAGLVMVEQLDPAQPFGALPEVLAGHDQP